MTGAISVIRYYAGWADKLSGQTVEVRSYLSFTSGCLPPTIDERDAVDVYET